MVDWGNVPESEISEVCGRDAMKWAEAFCYTAKKIGVDLGNDPEGWMVGWFAAAMSAETANMTPEQHEHEAREKRRVNAFIRQL